MAGSLVSIKIYASKWFPYSKGQVVTFEGAVTLLVSEDIVANFLIANSLINSSKTSFCYIR